MDQIQCHGNSLMKPPVAPEKPTKGRTHTECGNDPFPSGVSVPGRFPEIPVISETEHQHT